MEMFSGKYFPFSLYLLLYQIFVESAFLSFSYVASSVLAATTTSTTWLGIGMIICYEYSRVLLWNSPAFYDA